MVDGVLGERVAQATVVGMGPRVVGLQPPRGDAVAGEAAQRAPHEGGNGRGLLVGGISV
jgi:hypothetical protein